jgi:epoxide hydrolase-like predicted phosphatase
MTAAADAAPGGITTVLWDFAGVVVSSPWPALTAAGRGDLELLIGPYDEDGDHPWHRLERGELAIAEWVGEVTRLGEAAGVEIDFAPLQAMLGELTVHTQVVDRIRALRADGYRLGLITNNIREGASSWRSMIPVEELFDVVVDSSEVGMRKPNPAIFHHALELLGDVEPSQAVFLDDAPGNVEGARRAGLHGIHVDDLDAALAELDALLG